MDVLTKVDLFHSSTGKNSESLLQRFLYPVVTENAYTDWRRSFFKGDLNAKTNLFLFESIGIVINSVKCFLNSSQMILNNLI